MGKFVNQQNNLHIPLKTNPSGFRQFQNEVQRFATIELST